MSALSVRALRKSYDAVEVVAGGPPPDLLLHAMLLVGYAAVGYALAIYFARKRFSS
jgi:hypothetical protein